MVPGDEELFIHHLRVPASSATFICFSLQASGAREPQAQETHCSSSWLRWGDAVTLRPSKQPVACQALCTLSRSLLSVNEERGPRQDKADGELASFDKEESCC